MRNYVPNERQIDRVCELWVRMLRAPVYDNGDATASGVVTKGLLHMLAEQTNNSTPEVLERFRTELKARLMQPFTHKPWREGAEPSTDWVIRLNVDYNPDDVLSASAEAAGLTSQFPIKTDCDFYRQNVIGVSMGYGAPHQHHFPMLDGRWLITTLGGAMKDEAALIAFAERGGREAFFTVEEAEVAHVNV